MLNWISETFFSLVSWIPIWLYADGSPRHLIVRGMLGLGLIVVVAILVVLRPDRVAVEWYRQHRAKGGKSGG